MNPQNVYPSPYLPYKGDKWYICFFCPSSYDSFREGSGCGGGSFFFFLRFFLTVSGIDKGLPQCFLLCFLAVSSISFIIVSSVGVALFITSTGSLITVFSLFSGTSEAISCSSWASKSKFLYAITSRSCSSEIPYNNSWINSRLQVIFRIPYIRAISLSPFGRKVKVKFQEKMV